METTKAEDFYNQEFNEKPARDSIFASVIGVTYQDGEIANEVIHSKDELLAFGIAFADQQTTSQNQTIERLRFQLEKLWACNVAFFRAMNNGKHIPELSKQLNKEIVATKQLLNTTEPTNK